MDALTVIPRALGSLFLTGAGADMDPRAAKRIILSNRISISIALLCLPYVIIYLRSDAGIMGWLELPIFLGYAAVHRLNKAGFTWFSRFWLITLANLDILTYTLSMGTSIGLHLFYLLAGCAPLVLFNGEEKKSLAYGITLSSLLFLGTEAFAPANGLLEPVAPASVHTLRLVELATMDLIQLLLIVYFLVGNRATELALARAGEEARAADDAKSRFLARMSGEIRLPLNQILGRAHILKQTSLGPERSETLEDIESSAQDLLGLVDEILDLSRIESGHMRLAEAPFSPLRLGHSVLRPFEFEAGRKDLDLRLEADPALPDHLLGDAARIKQVLRNLIGNAFKFTESGGVTLRILADREGERPGIRRLRFEVVDTGIGVPEGSREWIFQPFAQGDASTARKYDGVGLGLFISKQIVESMGGEIGLRPGAGGGSVFHFSLPLPGSAITFPGIAETGPGSAAGFAPSGTQAGPRTGPETEESTGTLPPEARRLRILAVDDHPLNLKVMESFLNAYGLSVDLAKSGESALEACARAAYHVIFMDCHMPGMDGYECTRRLRESGAARPATIIGVTADALENNLGRCLDAGMDALLIKPIMEPELRAKLAECALRLPRQGEAHG